MSSLKDLASLIMVPSLVKDGRLDTVKPLGNSIIHPDATGNNDGTDGSTPAEGNFTFSRGSNLAATRVDVNGLIEKGRENQILHSNSFSTSPWSSTRILSKTQGYTGYDGSNDAWLIIPNSDNNTHLQVQSVSVTTGVNTISVYAKSAGYDYLTIRDDSSGSSYARFDLASGVTSTTGSNAITSKMESVGNDWWRCSLTYQETATGNILFYVNNAYDYVGTYAGDEVSGIYLMNVQVENGLVATDYIETGASTAQAGILEDLPRLDYSGGASCPALLLEPQRTNLLSHSEYFGAWGKVNQGTGIAPVLSIGGSFPLGDGSYYNLQCNLNSGTTSSDRSYISLSGLSGTQFTAAKSIWIKNNSASEAVLFMGINFSADKFTLAANADWQRITIDGGVINSEFRIGLGGGSSQSDTIDVSIFGAQCEAGSYPTSYIPTMGSAVTRSSDAMANLDIPDFNDNTSFSVLLELTRNGISSSEIGSMFSFYNDSLTQQFWFHIDAPNAQVRLRDATNSNATMATISFDTDDRKKIAFSCEGSTLKTYADGVLSNTYNLVNVFNVDELRTAAKSFDVHQIVTFPTALTDSECIALTTI